MAAQVPYNPLSEVRPSGGGIPSISPNMPADAFGASQAQATQGFGAELGQAGQQTFETAMRFQQQQNETDANDAIVKYGDVLGKVEQDLKNKKGNEATAYLPEFQKTLKKSMDDIAGSLQSPMARLAFSRNATGYYERSMRAAGEYVGNESTKANIASYQGVIETDQAQAVRSYDDPSSFQASIDKITENSRTLAHTQGLDANAANHLIQLNVGKVYQSVAAARIATGDTSGARQLLDQAANTNIEGTNLPIMDRVSQLAMLKEVESKEAFDERHANDAENQRYIRQEHQERETAKAVGNALMTQIAKDPFSIDVTKIGQLNGLPWEQRERFADILTQWQKRVVGGDPEAKGDGKAFADTYNAIHLPASDPNKIVDENDIYALAREGMLTPQGANKLIGQLKDTPAESIAKKNFAAAMRKKLAAPDGYVTEGGLEAYNGFMAHAADAFQQGKLAHKTVAQLTDPKSPDYIGKDAESFAEPFTLEAAPGTVSKETPVKLLPLFSRLSQIPIGKAGAEKGQKELLDAAKANPKMIDRLTAYGRERGWINSKPKPPAAVKP